MRNTEINSNLKVHAIAGMYVTLFGFHLPQAACEGLLGASLHRFDHTENEAYFLKASRAFAETDPGFLPGTLHPTRDHPIQSFQWSDYTAKPGHDYTFSITALRGQPTDRQPFASTSVRLTTEAPESEAHDISTNSCALILYRTNPSL
jgi:hypothetical protein